MLQMYFLLTLDENVRGFLLNMLRKKSSSDDVLGIFVKRQLYQPSEQLHRRKMKRYWAAGRFLGTCWFCLQKGYQHEVGAGLQNWYMDVSKNSGTPKSSILIGFSIINHLKESWQTDPCDLWMDVSENSGTPKSSTLIGFSILNRPFWGTPIFGNTHMSSYKYPFSKKSRPPELDH